MKLSDTEKANLITKRACFKCKQPGHISRWCGKRPILENTRASPILDTPQNTPRNTPAPDKVTITSIGGIEGIYDLIKNRMDAEKETFIDLAQGF